MSGKRVESPLLLAVWLVLSQAPSVHESLDALGRGRVSVWLELAGTLVRLVNATG